MGDGIWILVFIAGAAAFLLMVWCLYIVGKRGE